VFAEFQRTEIDGPDRGGLSPIFLTNCRAN